MNIINKLKNFSRKIIQKLKSLFSQKGGKPQEKEDIQEPKSPTVREEQSSKEGSKKKRGEAPEMVTKGEESYPRNAVEEYREQGIPIRGDSFTNTFKKWYKEHHK